MFQAEQKQMLQKLNHWFNIDILIQEVIAMRFQKFENLVDYAVSGAMTLGEVSSVVEKLKACKAEIMKEISALPQGKERREAFKKLHDLTYRLYQAKALIYQPKSDGKEKKDTKIIEELTYISATAIAHMVLCYDCN